jgi:hypothetical protein
MWKTFIFKKFKHEFIEIFGFKKNFKLVLYIFQYNLIYIDVTNLFIGCKKLKHALYFDF